MDNTDNLQSNQVSKEKLVIGSDGIKKSVEKDIKKSMPAVMEYIWNGFDAGADKVSINYDIQSDIIKKLEIVDNGEGINFKKLNSTFKPFNESKKDLDNEKHLSLPHGRKGFGRLTFFLFCYTATWETIYYDKQENKNFKYKIKVSANSLDNYQVIEQPKETTEKTGTKVAFSQFLETMPLLNKKKSDKHLIQFKEFMSKEFGWFLELNPNYQILLNKTPITYSELIENNIPDSITIEDEIFNTKFIQWNKKFNKEYSHYYFLNSKGEEVFKRTTTLNNKGDTFYHSIYIQSKYFDNFKFQDKLATDTSLIGKNEKDKTYKKLIEEVNNYLYVQRKPFIKKISKIKIAEFKEDGVFPESKNEFEKIKNQDLELITQEVYEFMPNIFNSTNIAQKKIIISLLDQLLMSERRESILKIIKEITELSTEEIKDFENIITNYKLSNIVNTIKLIEDRFRLLKDLEKLVYEKEFYFLESDLQELIEKHYWIFGEEYHMIGAENDKFDKLLKIYYEKILKLDVTEIENHKISKKEVDLLISRKDMFGREIQNTIVEIKKPDIKIGEKELSQIKNYASIVKDEPKFNANNEKWTYYLIGRNYDDFITGEIESKGSNNGLIYSRNNYEIYVLNWADVINNVSFRLEYLKKSLELKKKNIVDSIPAETKDAFVKQFEENTAKIENLNVSN